MVVCCLSHYWNNSKSLIKCALQIADVLSTSNTKEILDEMWDYRSRWKFIGVELSIDMGTLDAIEKDCKMVDDCLLRVITAWLRNNPRPTREVIRVALQSKHVSNVSGNYHNHTCSVRIRSICGCNNINASL